MLVMNWKLALLIGALLVAKAVHTVKINRQMKGAFRKNRRMAGEVAARAEESLSGIRLVKAFAREAFELSRFEEKSIELRNTKFASYRLVGYFSGSINFFTNFINVVVILAGGWMITNGELQLSDFVAFLLYVNIFMRPVFRLTILAEVYQRGMAGFHRFEEIMHTAPSITDPPHPLALTHVKGDIDFHDLSFGYEPDRLILHHLNFAIPAGRRWPSWEKREPVRAPWSVCSFASMNLRKGPLPWMGITSTNLPSRTFAANRYRPAGRIPLRRYHC